MRLNEIWKPNTYAVGFRPNDVFRGGGGITSNKLCDPRTLGEAAQTAAQFPTRAFARTN